LREKKPEKPDYRLCVVMGAVEKKGGQAQTILNRKDLKNIGRQEGGQRQTGERVP